MGNLKVYGLSVVLMSLCGCIASGLDYKTTTKPDAPLGGSLTGSFEATDGSVVDLSVPVAEPTVLIFAQETCHVCIEETRAIRSELISQGQEPTKVRLLTVLAGADLLIGREWKADYQVPWKVGIDPDLKLFGQFCPEKQTPCLLIHIPGRGVVFRHTGHLNVAELPTQTGPWY